MGYSRGGDFAARGPHAARIDYECAPFITLVSVLHTGKSENVNLA